MQEPNIPQEWQVKLDFENGDYSRATKILKPVVYQDGDSYCCLLGPDPVLGIFGCGDKPDDAIKDWEDSLARRISMPEENDELSLYVVDKLTTWNTNGEAD